LALFIGEGQDFDAALKYLALLTTETNALHQRPPTGPSRPFIGLNLKGSAGPTWPVGFAITELPLCRRKEPIIERRGNIRFGSI